MLFLQIWLGPNFPEEHRECIESVRHLVGEKDQYVFIGNRKIPGIDIVPFRKVVNEINKSEKFAPLWEHCVKYHVVNERFNKYMAFSDFIRMYYCSVFSEVLYCDVDLYLKKMPNFEDDGTPYFGDLSGKKDIFLMYNNMNRGFFYNALLEGKKRHMKPYRGLYFKLLNSKEAHKLHCFPKDSYEHRSLNFRKNNKFVSPL